MGCNCGKRKRVPLAPTSNTSGARSSSTSSATPTKSQINAAKNAGR